MLEINPKKSSADENNKVLLRLNSKLPPRSMVHSENHFSYTTQKKGKHSGNNFSYSTAGPNYDQLNLPTPPKTPTIKVDSRFPKNLAIEVKKAASIVYEKSSVMFRFVGASLRSFVGHHKRLLQHTPLKSCLESLLKLARRIGFTGIVMGSISEFAQDRDWKRGAVKALSCAVVGTTFMLGAASMVGFSAGITAAVWTGIAVGVVGVLAWNATSWLSGFLYDRFIKSSVNK